MQFLHLGFSSPHFMRRFRHAVTGQLLSAGQQRSRNLLKQPVLVRFFGPLGAGTFLGIGSDTVGADAAGAGSGGDEWVEDDPLAISG